MIISASRRTDIPAFHSQWLMDALGVGRCQVQNPFNPRQRSEISLDPVDVDVIAFWTKNPEPLIPHLDRIDNLGHRYFFLFTINNYPQIIEPGLPDLQTRIDTFKALSNRIGAERMIWRYDPIVISGITCPDYHLQQFSMISHALAGYTNRVIISFMDEYRHVLGRIGRLGIGYKTIGTGTAETNRLVESMANVSQCSDMGIYSCAEPVDLAQFGVARASCIDSEYIDRVFGITVSGRKDRNQRSECGCVISRDIGSYNTCRHGCAYCYAQRTVETASEIAQKSEAQSD